MPEVISGACNLNIIYSVWIVILNVLIAMGLSSKQSCLTEVYHGN